MTALIVTSDPKDWPFEIPDVQVLDAKSYLTCPEYASAARSTRVFNLCAVIVIKAWVIMCPCWQKLAGTSQCQA